MEKTPIYIKVTIGCTNAVFHLTKKEYSKYNEKLLQYNRGRTKYYHEDGKCYMTHPFDMFADVDVFSFFTHFVSRWKRERFLRIFGDKCHCYFTINILNQKIDKYNKAVVSNNYKKVKYFKHDGFVNNFN